MPPRSPEDEELRKIAEKIARLRLQTPALLFLEIHKPLTTLFYNTCLALGPVASPLFGTERISVWLDLLKDRKNIDKLSLLIETYAKDGRRCESAEH